MKTYIPRDAQLANTQMTIKNNKLYALGRYNALYEIDLSNPYIYKKFSGSNLSSEGDISVLLSTTNINDSNIYHFVKGNPPSRGKLSVFNINTHTWTTNVINMGDKDSTIIGWNSIVSDDEKYLYVLGVGNGYDNSVNAKKLYRISTPNPSSVTLIKEVNHITYIGSAVNYDAKLFYGHDVRDIYICTDNYKTMGIANTESVYSLLKNNRMYYSIFNRDERVDTGNGFGYGLSTRFSNINGKYYQTSLNTLQTQEITKNIADDTVPKANDYINKPHYYDYSNNRFLYFTINSSTHSYDLEIINDIDPFKISTVKASDSNSIINSIQRRTAIINAGNSNQRTVTIPISTIDVAKSTVVLSGAGLRYSSDSMSSTGIYVKSLNPNSLVVETDYAGGSSSNSTFSYEIIEYK